MMRLLALAVLLPFALEAQEQHSPDWTMILQQRSLYFSSDRVTMAGVGAGAGVQAQWNSSLVAEADVNILWGNGNVIPTRLALGIQRDGHWSPAIFGTISLLWGQRVEMLSESGQRPAIPVWVIGVLAAPLRFEGSEGFASALEFGYGIGPDRGRSLELTILSVGAKW